MTTEEDDLVPVVPSGSAVVDPLVAGIPVVAGTPVVGTPVVEAG